MKKRKTRRHSAPAKMIQVEQIEGEIRRLLAQYNYPVLVSDMQTLQQWAITNAMRLHLSWPDFVGKVTEVFWAAINVQLSLGYALFARQTCIFPRGIKGAVFDETKIPMMMKLPELHYWHHTHHAWECIYRCWERITNVLVSACYPDQSANHIYYSTILKLLTDDIRFKDNPQLRRLKKHEKHWNKVADIRNELTHAKSTPIKLDVQAEAIPLVDGRLEHFIKYHYSAPNLIQELNIVKEAYLKIIPAWRDTMKFIDGIGENS
jgi:hypothetical protein